MNVEVKQVKLSEIKLNHVDFWRYKKCNIKSNTCQSASLF